MTILKFKEMFGKIAERHEMISDFGYGPSFEMGTDRTMKYPLTWFELIDSTVILGESGNGMLTQQYRFYIYCLDKVIKGDDNYNVTTSTCDYIIKTIIAELDQNTDYIDMNMRLDSDITLEPVYEQTEDICNGFQAILSFRLPMRYNPCNSPIN